MRRAWKIFLQERREIPYIEDLRRPRAFTMLRVQFAIVVTWSFQSSFGMK
jgi:hypothetical protein